MIIDAVIGVVSSVLEVLVYLFLGIVHFIRTVFSPRYRASVAEGARGRRTQFTPLHPGWVMATVMLMLLVFAGVMAFLDWRRPSPVEQLKDRAVQEVNESAEALKRKLDR